MNWVVRVAHKKLECLDLSRIMSIDMKTKGRGNRSVWLQPNSIAEGDQFEDIFPNVVENNNNTRWKSIIDYAKVN